MIRRCPFSWFMISLCCFVNLYVWIAFHSSFIRDRERTRVSLSRRRSHRHYHPAAIRAPDNASKIILFGYLRGGTTFLGNVLGVREDSFYLYEPLFDFGSFVYFKSKKTCRMTTNKCRSSHMDKTIVQVLESMFRCEFIDVQRHLRLWQFNKGQGAVKMEPPKECKYMRGAVQSCLRLQAQRCHNATARVFKIARTDLGLLQESLAKHPHSKIIYLIRDPRAILHSRFSLWSDEYKNFQETAQGLCSKMLKDYEISQMVSAEKLTTIVLENFVQDPIRYTKFLFSFVGYVYTDLDENRLLQMTKSSRQIPQSDSMWSTEKTDSYLASQEWRKHISLTMKESIDSECGDIYRVFGYKTFRSLTELRNVSILPIW